MERELRRKFVLVTMLLMVLTFSVFFIVSHYFTQYWYDMDTLTYVQWMADSDVLLEQDATGMELVDSMGEHDSVVAVIVNKSGEIVDELFVSGSERRALKLVGRILSRDDGYKISSYVYAIKHLSDDQKLIVMADTRMYSSSVWYVVSMCILIAGGMLALFLLTWTLSRFVTKPAKEAMLREKQFISDASHELKTPLGAISINAQALAATGEVSPHLRNILHESKRMTRLIERLLTLSQMEEVQPSEQTEVKLSDCIEEMALTYESVAYEKQIGYSYEIAEELSVTGNEDELRQLTAILIDNAIKHTEPGGNMEIRLFRKGKHVHLTVANTGDPIPPDALPHIFDRFYQSDTSRSDNTFGLGLAIAKAVTERNHGTITVRSERITGTVFTVEFKAA